MPPARHTPCKRCHVVDSGRHEKGDSRLLEITAACEEPAGKLRNAVSILSVGEGIVTFDQSNLVGPAAVQHVVHAVAVNV